MDHKRLKVRII